MKRRAFDPAGVRAAHATVQLSDFREIDATAEERSPFATYGYKPDRWKMFVEFNICHSIPTLIGPVEAGNYIGYYPETLAASHESLRFQQFNLNHKLKAYSPKEKAPGLRSDVARDRIIGCVVATYVPPAPSGGWLSPSNPKGATTHIRACAVVFKLAEGVAAVMGDHLTSRKTQSVSIECTTSIDNIGILVPSTGALCPILDPTDEVLSAMEEPTSDKLLPHVGKLNGEQLAVIYGLNGRPVSMRGVGMTPNPAERVAKIVNVSAEDGSDLIGIAAEAIDTAMVGQEVTFKSGRTGRVRQVHTSGRARLRGASWSMAASEEDPVLEIEIGAGRDTARVLRRCSEIL